MSYLISLPSKCSSQVLVHCLHSITRPAEEKEVVLGVLEDFYIDILDAGDLPYGITSDNIWSHLKGVKLVLERLSPTLLELNSKHFAKALAILKAASSARTGPFQVFQHLSRVFLVPFQD